VGSPVLILLRSSDWESRFEATTLAVTAAALGDRVLVALFGQALRAWVEGRFDEGAPSAAAPVGSLSRALDEGRRDLGVELVACETAIRVAGLEPEAVRPTLDAVRSLPQIWQHGGRVLTF
jgi:peroxiredoxin family protein